MLRGGSLSVAFLIGGLFAAPALAADDNSACKDESATPEVAIEACTRIIKATKSKNNDLALI